MLHHDKNESSANNMKGKLFIVHKSLPLDNKHCDFQFSFADCEFYSPVLCFNMPFPLEVAGYSHFARSALFCFLFCFALECAKECLAARCLGIDIAMAAFCFY